MRNRKRKIIAILFALMLITPPVVARADSEINILQAYTSDQVILMFTNGELQAEPLQCSISSQNADIIETALLSDERTMIKTTILLDISTSIPIDMRDAIMSALRQLIESKRNNEQFTLIVFGETLNVLQDFTSDRYDLANAVDQIEYNGSQSKIYDAIYNTIPSMISSDNEAIFYRTIVMTDGVDDTTSGVTKEELFLNLQNERYPIDVVAVSSYETVEDKDLSAIVRISNGRYHAFHSGTDIAGLVQALDVGTYFYIKAQIPAALLDGATRQVDITDGVYRISIDVKCPVNSALITSEPAAESNQDASPKPTPQPAEAVETAPVQTSAYDNANESLQEESGLDWAQSNLVFIVISAVVLLLLIILTIILFIKSKKRNVVIPILKTSVPNISTDINDQTELTENANIPDAQFTIKLSSPNNPSKVWVLTVLSEILIGRADYCSIHLADKSVSREQCKIIPHGNGLAVVHISSSNKTLLNGSNVNGVFPIKSGDTLKFGREALRIDYIQSLGHVVQNSETLKDSDNRKTESIF